MGDTRAIRHLIEQYVQSVNDLDVALAESLWDDEKDASFIQPRGHEIGFPDIRRGFYRDTMGKFSQRSLKPKDISIRVIGNAALVMFYWDFSAVFQSDGSAHDTHGRETQVLVKKNGTWRIAHIHYSAMPVTGEKEGF